MPESTYPMLSVPDALDVVLAQAAPLPPIRLPAAAALGCVLAQPVAAADALPPFAASVKDGYAVVAADGPGDYPLVGTVTAGRMAAFTVHSGTVAYITTGSPLPPGADAVVMVEETEPLPAVAGRPFVRIRARVQAGSDIRPIGYDVAAGETVLPAGVRLGAAELGLLATVGVTAVDVYPRPRVAIMATGDELVPAGAPLGPGQIRDSNGPTLSAAVSAAGGEVIDLGIVGDSQAAVEEGIQQALAQADILITSGGVSMGDLDFVKPALEHAGRVHFGRLRMKPGKPLTFATAEVDGRRRLIFGLPGNPVSSLVTFYLLGQPAIHRLAGWPEPRLPRVQAVLAQALALDAQRPEYHRALLAWEPALNGGSGGFRATSTGNQASSRLLSLRSANALLELPAGEGLLPAGAVVSALLIGDLAPGG